MNNKINNEFVANFARDAGNVFDNALNWANDSKDPIISSNLKIFDQNYCPAHSCTGTLSVWPAGMPRK